MRKMNVLEPKEWTAGSRFESECLAIDFAAGQITPLYHAGYLRWNELAILLMEHGASPQGQCWGHPGSNQTVLGQLLPISSNQLYPSMECNRGSQYLTAPEDTGGPTVVTPLKCSAASGHSGYSTLVGFRTECKQKNQREVLQLSSAEPLLLTW
jgi:hypothetical protein